MNKYIWVFLGVNFVAGIVLEAILHVLNMGTNVGNVVAVMIAGYFSGYCFASDKKRTPNNDEKHQFTIHALIYLTIIGVIIFLVIIQFLPEPLMVSDLLFFLKNPIIFCALLVITMVYYFAVKYFFGLGATVRFKQP